MLDRELRLQQAAQKENGTHAVVVPHSTADILEVDDFSAFSKVSKSFRDKIDVHAVLPASAILQTPQMASPSALDLARCVKLDYAGDMSLFASDASLTTLDYMLHVYPGEGKDLMLEEMQKLRSALSMQDEVVVSSMGYPALHSEIGQLYLKCLVIHGGAAVGLEDKELENELLGITTLTSPSSSELTIVEFEKAEALEKEKEARKAWELKEALDYGDNRTVEKFENAKRTEKLRLINRVLNHPNIVEIGAASEIGGVAITDLPAGSLAKATGANPDDVLKSALSDFSVILKLSIDMARGIRYFHFYGVAHLYVIPSTVFLVRNPDNTFTAQIAEGRVTDALGLGNSNAGSNSGSANFAYYYSEYFYDDDIPSPPDSERMPDDVFALATIINQLMDKTRPWEGKSGQHILIRSLNRQRPLAFDPKNHPVKNSLKALLGDADHMALHQDAQCRPTADDLCTRLEKLAEENLQLLSTMRDKFDGTVNKRPTKGIDDIVKFQTYTTKLKFAENIAQIRYFDKLKSVKSLWSEPQDDSGISESQTVSNSTTNTMFENNAIAQSHDSSVATIELNFNYKMRDLYASPAFRIAYFVSQAQKGDWKSFHNKVSQQALLKDFAALAQTLTAERKTVIAKELDEGLSEFATGDATYERFLELLPELAGAALDTFNTVSNVYRILNGSASSETTIPDIDDSAYQLTGEKERVGPIASVHVGYYEGRKAALKAYDPKAKQHNTVGYAAIERETELMNALAHPNILAVKAARFDTGMVLTTYAACSLASVLNSNDFPTVTEGLRADASKADLFVDILKGLAHLHLYHIAHKNLVPENILLERVGAKFSAKISDFGRDDELLKLSQTHRFTKNKNAQNQPMSDDPMAADIQAFEAIAQRVIHSPLLNYTSRRTEILRLFDRERAVAEYEADNRLLHVLKNTNAQGSANSLLYSFQEAGETLRTKQKMLNVRDQERRQLLK